MSSGGLGPDGKVYCKHNEEAVKRKAKTSKHPNRDFYCCKRPVGGTSKCKFFLWADDLVLPKDSDSTLVGPGDSASGSSTVPTVPRPPNEEAKTTVRSVPASPTRPLERRFKPSLSTGSLLGTPQSVQRLKDIEVGLQQREQDLSLSHDLGLSEEAGSFTSSGIEANPQPPSPVPTEIDDTADLGEQPGKSFRSFLGLDYGPPQAGASVKDEAQPSTPKKRRLTPPPTGDTGKQPDTDAVSSGNKLPLTPPQTTHRMERFVKPKQVSSASSSRKGKERERAPSAQTQDQIQYDQVAGLQEDDALPLFTNPEDTYSSSSASPTTAENVLDYTNGVKARVKGLSEYMDSFEIDQALELLQSAERQRMQYEFRDRSQKKRMEELVTENDKLAAEVSRLKEALQRSETSNRTKDAEIATLLRGR